MALVQKNHTISKRKLKKKKHVPTPTPPLFDVSTLMSVSHMNSNMNSSVSPTSHVNAPFKFGKSTSDTSHQSNRKKHFDSSYFLGVANFEPLLYLQVAENPPPPRTSFLLRSTVWFAKVVV